MSMRMSTTPKVTRPDFRLRFGICLMVCLGATQALPSTAHSGGGTPQKTEVSWFEARLPEVYQAEKSLGELVRRCGKLKTEAQRADCTASGAVDIGETLTDLWFNERYENDIDAVFLIAGCRDRQPEPYEPCLAEAVGNARKAIKKVKMDLIKRIPSKRKLAAGGPTPEDGAKAANAVGPSVKAHELAYRSVGEQLVSSRKFKTYRELFDSLGRQDDSRSATAEP